MATDNPSNNGKQLAKAIHSQNQALMLSMANQVQGKLKVKSLPNDEVFAATFPRLWDWLTATQIGDAMEKDPPRVVLSVESSTWKATLSDNALRCSLTGVGITFDLALKNLEHLMGQQDAPWVLWKQRGKALRDIVPQEVK